MRAAGKLEVPVATLVLDFYVHSMWVHGGVDAHLLLHPSQVPQVDGRGGRAPVVCGPLVRPGFDLASPSWERQAARASLGLGADDLCVLVVGGSWGVGKVAETFALVASDGRFFPVGMAGHNPGLKRSLLAARQGSASGIVLGWVDDMDRVMAAADVAVENAGGLTAMEAMARGVPVVTYTPIAGHGRANALAMAEAGVAVYAHSPSDLVSCLVELGHDTPAKRRLVRRGAFYVRRPRRAHCRVGAVGCGRRACRSRGRLGRQPGLPCRPSRHRPLDWRPPSRPSAQRRSGPRARSAL